MTTSRSETTEEQPRIPKELPVLPLRDLVVYPFIIVPLSVSREKSIKAVEKVDTTFAKAAATVDKLDTSLARVPDLMLKLDRTLSNVEAASADLPQTMRDARVVARDSRNMLDGAKQNWPFNTMVSEPAREQALPLDSFDGPLKPVR